MNDLSIQLHDYDIVLSDDLTGLSHWLSEQEYSQYFVLTDTNTEMYCLPLLMEATSQIDWKSITVPEGEEHKNLETCSFIWREMLAQHADRSTLMVNLGGGVIGDMGGFAASCFKRGIDFINIPTTVLSQVDASIGGKLGVDFDYGKNLIGMFKNPKRVHISTCFHQSLDPRQYMNGLAEVFKHAIIGSPELWQLYKQAADLAGGDQRELLRDALLVKKVIAEKDPFEHAERKALNFGHTIGHAVEAYSLEHDEDPLLHGEAVAIGMIAETFLSTRKCGLPEPVMLEINEVLLRHYPVYPIRNEQLDMIWSFMQYDKKNIGSKVMASMIEDIGKPVWNIELTKEDVLEALAYYQRVTSS